MFSSFLILQTKNEPSPFGKETEKAHLCCTTPVKRRRTLAAIEEKKSPHFVKFRNIFRTAAFVIAILPSALGISLEVVHRSGMVPPSCCFVLCI